MSENLSIDEIIKRAEKIKAEADRQLEAASKTLDEKAKNAIDEVTVDEEEVARKIAEAAAKPTADEDIKEYVPPKKQKPSVEKTQEVSLPKKREKSEGRIQFDTSKTKPIVLDDDSDMKIADDDVKIVPTVKKSKNPFAKKEKQSPDISKTRRVAFVSNAQKDEKTDLEGIPTIVAKDKVFDNEPEFTDSTIKSSLFRQSTKRLPSRFWSNAVRKRSASSAFSVPMRRTKTSAIPKSRAAIMSASRKGSLSFKACLAKGLPSNQKLLPPLFSVQFFCF